MLPHWTDPLLEHLSECGSLRAVCKLPGMPSRSTVARRIAEDPEFAAAYARAKAVGIDNFIEETMEIADEEILAIEVPRARLRVETRRWLAERMLPKSYGPKAGLELSGDVAVNIDESAAAARAAQLLAIWKAREEGEDFSDIA